jgi:hypothetical protein
METTLHKRKKGSEKMKKLVLILILVMAVILLFFINGSKNAKPAASNSQKDGNIVVYQPQKDDSVMTNPFIGFAPWANSTSYSQDHSLVYANFTWRQLEPEKGQYDFSAIEKENNLEYWKKKNVKLIFRIVLDTPGPSKHMDIPDWLYQEINQDGTWYDHAWGKGFSPNYSNKKLIALHEELLKKLAERYNNDPEIAFIELGSIGHWGEWHTLQQDGIYIPFPKLPVVETYVNQYVKYFSNKILLMRRPHQIALDNKMGLYNDMFGKKKDTVDSFWNWVKNGYTLWLTGEKMPAMPDYWKYGPTGGELAPVAHREDYFSSANFSETISELNLTHVSWVGPGSPADYPRDGKLQPKIDQLLKKMGYHFRIVKETHPQKVKPGDSFMMTMDGENSGVAPFYYSWPLEISLADAKDKIVYKQQVNTDIRKWLPGMFKVDESISLPSDLPAGEYHLCVAILDPATKKPGMNLEMAGKRDDGRYKLGKIIIE